MTWEAIRTNACSTAAGSWPDVWYAMRRSSANQGSLKLIRTVQNDCASAPVPLGTGQLERRKGGRKNIIEPARTGAVERPVKRKADRRPHHPVRAGRGSHPKFT